MLRQARQDATMTVDTAAALARMPRAGLYAIEAGKVPPPPTVADRLCDLYSVWGVLRAAVTRLVEEGATDAWWRADRTVLPPGDGLSFSLDAAATRIRSYQPTLLPAVLRSDAYAEAVFALYPDATTDRVARRVAVHRRHRAAAAAGRARLDVIMDEAVLQRMPVSTHSRPERFAYLSTEFPAAGRTLRVVPAAAGLHPGSAVGAFTIFDLPDIADGVPAPTIVYRPAADGAVYLDVPEAVELYRGVWASLTDLAEQLRPSRIRRPCITPEACGSHS